MFLLNLAVVCVGVFIITKLMEKVCTTIHGKLSDPRFVKL